MANMKVFMKIDGMPGSSLDKDHSDFCDVFGFDHTMEYPFNMRDAEGRGEPIHKPVMVVKRIDKASPKIYEALAKKKKVN